MQTGRTLVDMATEIMRQSRSKKDFVASDALWSMEGIGGRRTTANIGTHGVHGITPIAHGQISNRLNIPKPYYDTMLRQAPELLATNVNHWLSKSDKKRMLRTLDGDLRAVLSDRYRALDNGDLMEAVLPIFNEESLEIKACQVTDSRMYIQALSPQLKGDVKEGDPVQGGIVISNSEVGMGRLNASLWIYRLVCLNGMITGSTFKQVHVGKSVSRGVDLSDAQEFFSDGTRKLADAAFFRQVTDVVKGILSENHFGKMMQELRDSTERKIEGDPVKSIEVLANRFTMTDDEQGGVLRHLIEGGDLSAWGVANAVTSLAHDAETYDRNIELQRAGSQVIELDRTDWESIANAA